MLRFFAIIITLFSTGSICAVNLPLYRPIENIHSDLYGGGSKIWAVEPGENGCVFFAAGSSFCVWTGSHWDNYQTQAVTRALAYDCKTDRIYCAGDNFFGYWAVDEYGDFVFHQLYANRDLLHGQIFWRIIAQNEMLYLQTHEALLRYDIQTATTSVVVENADIGYIYKFGDEIYLQSNGRLFSVVGDRLTATGVSCNDRIVDVARVAGDWLIVTETGGINRYHAGVLHNEFPSLNQELADMRIFSAARTSDGSYVIGTILGGAYVIDASGSIVYRFDENTGLELPTVLSIGTMPDGDVWLGLDGGIARIDIHSAEWLYRSIDRRIGNVYTAVIWNNALYIGTNTGLYVVKEGTPAQLIRGTQGQVWHLEVCGENLLIVHDRGLFSMTSDDRWSLLHSGIWKFTPWRSDPNLYIASDREGVLFFERKNGKVHLRNRLEGYEGYRNISARNDRFGSLWVDELTGCVQRIVIDADKRKAIRKRFYRVGDENELVYAFYFDDELVFTQNQNCYVYDCDRDTIKFSEYYSRIASTFSPECLSMQQSGNHFFNFNGAAIEHTIRGDKQHNRRPDLFLSLTQREFSDQYSKLQALNDTLVAIGCANGLAVYNVAPQESEKSPAIKIRKITYNLFGKEEAVLMKRESSISVPYAATNLKIEFWGINQPGSIRYSLDEGEVEPLTDESVFSVPYMQSGTHCLSLIDSNRNRVFEFEFDVKRHWSSTWWFIIGVIILFILLCIVGMSVYNQRIAKLRKRYADQQQETLERERIKYENEILSVKLREQNKKLTSMAMNDIHINHILKEISDELEQIASAKSIGTELKPAKRIVDRYMRDNGSWSVFESYFNGVYDGFFDRLRTRYPNLTNNDLKICAYIRLGMSTKEIASMMNIEVASAESARYRLRKNIGLTGNESLTALITKI